MRKEAERQELQVLDYMTWPITRLVSHPDYREEMFLSCIKLARMTSYGFDAHMTTHEIVDGLSYNQRQQLRDFFKETFDKYIPV